MFQSFALIGPQEDVLGPQTPPSLKLCLPDLHLPDVVGTGICTTNFDDDHQLATSQVFRAWNLHQFVIANSIIIIIIIIIIFIYLLPKCFGH